jgi:hypothetical protein
MNNAHRIVDEQKTHLHFPTDIDFLTSDNFSNFDHGILVAHQLVARNENQLSALGPVTNAIIEHLPGLDKFGTGWEQVSVGNVVVGDERGSERGLWDGGGYRLDGPLRHNRRNGSSLRFYGWLGIRDDAGFLNDGLRNNWRVGLHVWERVEPLSKISLEVQVPKSPFKVQVSEKGLLIWFEGSRDARFPLWKVDNWNICGWGVNGFHGGGWEGRGFFDQHVQVWDEGTARGLNDRRGRSDRQSHDHWPRLDRGTIREVNDRR